MNNNDYIVIGNVNGKGLNLGNAINLKNKICFLVQKIHSIINYVAVNYTTHSVCDTTVYRSNDISWNHLLVKRKKNVKKTEIPKR
jgi:hypothetical protein